MKQISKMASMMGKKGGKNSVKSRFSGKTKTEISEIMRNVRYSKNNKNKSYEIHKRISKI